MSCLPHLEACVVPSDTMKASPKTHIQVIYRLIRLHLGIYIYIYETTVHDKGGHAFEREQGRIYGRVWREQKEIIFVY